ncbi:SDR family NAD(P)-dependent oxidoreductase [Kitasatospora viridis]|uniref:3-oxoacyl-[acyl-carrier protein] reductase n=1 Tax=Kitasatospora viridis TaxID=281105 RepID=A0A561UCE1_9ACTN|nr:SDR family NAD(P)-dependent oxidoreductase [Kitasatospora viridis]TWF97035.1 3-oxoacyl-[acyl-carrier protein] reductase [Kitasatospora viridis]
MSTDNTNDNTADNTAAATANGYPVYPDLIGRTALITGASRGIGAETARALAANGVRVVLAARDKSAVEETAEAIRAAGGSAVGFAADCTEQAELERLRELATEAVGPIDVLGAFVGGGGDPVPIERMDLAQFRSVVDLNLTSTFLAVQTFLPSMIERRRGSIITMASTAGRLPGFAAASYAAAKAGVLMFTRHVAGEVGKHGVRVNCVSPSAIMTESQRERIPADRLPMIVKQFPLGRIGEPVDVAQAALFLASDASSWLTGLTIDVAGGRIMI